MKLIIIGAGAAAAELTHFVNHSNKYYKLDLHTHYLYVTFYVGSCSVTIFCKILIQRCVRNYVLC